MAGLRTVQAVQGTAAIAVLR